MKFVIGKRYRALDNSHLGFVSDAKGVILTAIPVERSLPNCVTLVGKFEKAPNTNQWRYSSETKIGSLDINNDYVTEFKLVNCNYQCK